MKTKIAEEIIKNSGIAQVSPKDDKAYIQKNGSWEDAMNSLGGHMMYNTRTVLTTSGTYAVPVTGWYEITCIGGGGAGGSAIGVEWNGRIGRGGGQGGTTSFGEYLNSVGGSGGGTGSHACSSGGGGGASIPSTSYVYLTLGQSVPVTVGAGGLANGSSSIDGSGPKGGKGTIFYGWIAWGAPGQGGGSNGQSGTPNSYAPTREDSFSGRGGNGGSNGTGYGGGGGGAKNYYNGADCETSGLGGDNGHDGNTPTPNVLSYGGAGGSGAIIICYVNPAKANG